MTIISFAANLPDLSAIQSRLLRNQDDTGAAFAPYIGASRAATLTQLLRGHILGAVEVLKAAKAGAPGPIAAAQAAWQKNADQISDLLAQALRLDAAMVVRPYFRTHLETTTSEALARLRGDWLADLAAYDAARSHMLRFADLMADRLAQSF